MYRVVAPFQEGPAEEEDAVQGCSPPTRSHHRQRAMLAQVLGRGWLKVELDTRRLKLSWVRVPELGSVRGGQDPPRVGSAESVGTGSPWCRTAGSRTVVGFHSGFAASKPRPAPAAGRGTVPRARLRGGLPLTLGGAAKPRTAP